MIRKLGLLPLAAAVMLAASAPAAGAGKDRFRLLGFDRFRQCVRGGQRGPVQEARARRRDEARAELLDDAGGTDRRQPAGRNPDRAGHPAGDRAGPRPRRRLPAAAIYVKGITDVAVMVKPGQPDQDGEGFRGQARLDGRPQCVPARAVPQVDGGEWRRLQEGDIHRERLRPAARRAALRPGRRDPGGAAVPGARAGNQHGPRRLLLHRRARGRNASGWYVATRKWVQGEPESGGSASLRPSTEATEHDRQGPCRRAQGEPGVHPVPGRRAGEVRRRALPRRRSRRKRWTSGTRSRWSRPC